MSDPRRRGAGRTPAETRYDPRMGGIFQLLMRMALWVRRPPSRSQLLVMLIVVLVAAFCVGFEAIFGWPDWLTVQRPPRGILLRP